MNRKKNMFKYLNPINQSKKMRKDSRNPEKNQVSMQKSLCLIRDELKNKT